jgi:hypothetical protein
MSDDRGRPDANRVEGFRQRDLEQEICGLSDLCLVEA